MRSSCKLPQKRKISLASPHLKMARHVRRHRLHRSSSTPFNRSPNQINNWYEGKCEQLKNYKNAAQARMFAEEVLTYFRWTSRRSSQELLKELRKNSHINSGVSPGGKLKELSEKLLEETRKNSWRNSTERITIINLKELFEGGVLQYFPEELRRYSWRTFKAIPEKNCKSFVEETVEYILEKLRKNS